MTHDSDFGKLAIQAGEPYTGILFLRPGHISPEFVLGALVALEASLITVTPPFIVVVERKDAQVRVRVRSGG
jgi:predicted nuclease of predicted toxin-antitoxin system